MRIKCFIRAGLLGGLLGGLLLAQPAGTTTSLSITGCSSGCTVQLGRTVSATATVQRQVGGAAITTGSVAFYSGTTFIAAGGPPNASGQVSISTRLLPAEVNAISARYETNGSFSSSISSGIPVTVQSIAGNGFAPALTFPTGLGPNAVATGDFNNDGIPDFAVANTTSGTVTIFFGNGTGGFTSDPDGPFTVGTNPTAIVTGDFNGDGKLDIATANNNSGSGTNNISILINSGNFSATTATFSTAVSYSTGSGTASASAIAIGDFDGDAIPDLAVANNQVSGTVSVLLGSHTAPGTFGAATTYSVGSLPNGIAVGDFNGDGVADIATANGATGSNNVSVLLNQGGGTFPSIPTNLSTENGTSPPTSIVVADFNTDGRPDLAVANSGSSNVSVFLGSMTGVFTLLSGGPFAVGGNPTGIVAGDFNGDGLIDIATVDNGVSGASGVSVILGLSGGGFGTSSQYSTSSGSSTDNPRALVAADFNGDGIADIVTADPASGSGFHMSVLIGLVPTVTTLTSASPNPGTFGSSVTLAGSVGPGVSAGDTVTFFAGSTNVGTYTFSASATPGNFSFATSAIPQGPQSLTATYNGGSTYATSTTASPLQFSNPASSTTALTVSPNPSITGQNVLLTATVTPGATGTVNFYNFENLLGSALLNQNTPNIATLQTSALSAAPATNSITAQYQTDGNYASSTSSPAINEVILNATTTALTSSVNPSSVGQQITLTANVTSGGSGTITGAVSFYQNGTVLLGSATLPANTISYTFNSGGSEPLTAVYTPDSGSSGTFAGSTSNLWTQTVLTSTNTSLTEISPVAPLFGRVVSLEATVNPVPGAPPYGKVTFLDGATVLGTGSVSVSGNATFTTPLLSQGVRNLRARYEINPTAGLGPSTSTPSQITVGSAAQSGFSSVVNYATGSNSVVAVGDFNADGIDDIVATENSAIPFFQGANILLGNGNGTFQNAVGFATRQGPSAVTVADVNGDSLADIVLTTPAGIEVLLNSPGSPGTFIGPSKLTITSGITGESIAVADMNGDGIPDAIVGATGTVSIFLGAGDGTFGASPSASLPTANATFLTTADFNNDGKADIAAVDTSGNLYIFIGNGDGTVQTPVINVTQFAPTTGSLLSIATGDFNHDGFTDIVMGGTDASADKLVFLYAGSEDGSFSSATIPTNGLSYQIATGDFNGDGKPDILTTDLSSAAIEVIPGNNDLTFGAAVSYPISTVGISVAVGNFSSGNGRGDVVVSYESSAVMGVVLSTLAGPTVTCTSLSPTVIVGSAFSLSCPASGGVSPYSYAFGSGSALTPASPAFAVDASGLVTGTPTATGPYTFTVQATDHSSPTALIGVSPTVTLTVNPKITTSTTLTRSSGSNPTVMGQSVTLQATVSPTPTGGGGVVVFFDGTNGIGSSNVSSGVAQFPTANLTLGSHSITAVYNGDSADAGSTSTALVEVVNSAAITFSYVSLVDGSSPLQPLGYFRLEGVSGTSEVNGYTYSATAASVTSGAPIGVSGNQALQFNGSTSAVTTSLSGGIGSAASIVAWVNLSVLPSTLNATEYIAGESQGGNDFDLQFTAANVLGFYTTNSNQSISWAPPTGSLPGTWHQVVATFDNDDGSAVRALYWDGKQVASDSTTSLTNKTGNFQIGATSVFPGRSFDGLIDEVAVFNYALTPLQVTQIYYTPLLTLPNGLKNQLYGPLTMTATGGSGSFIWAATGLPTGLGLSSAGVLNGSPSVSGTFSPVVITATDTSTSQTASLTYSLTVGPVASTLSLSASPNPATPSAAVTLSANVTPAAAGTATPTGSVQFYDGETLLGTVGLPGNGAPATQTVTNFALGAHSLTAQYAGDANFSSSSSTLTETVSTQPVSPQITILTNILPAGLVGQSYSASLSASGGAGTYTWSSGTLPAGLNLSSLGAISGTPAAAFSGVVSFSVTDPGGDSATTFLNLSITVGPLSLSGNGNLGDIPTGTPTAASFTTSGGAPGVHTWGISGISGLIVDSNGNVRGAVTTPGNYSGTLTVTDSSGARASTNLTLAVLGLSGNFSNGTTTAAYSGSASGIGGVAPYTYTASGVPFSLSFSAGALTGTVTTAGTYTIGVSVTDANSVSVSGTFTFKITGPAPKTLTITSTSLPSGFAGQFYSQTLGAAGGNPGYTWSQSGGYLTPGLSIDNAGNIAGTPTATSAGSFTIGVQVTDTSGAKVAGTVSLQIGPAPLQISNGSNFPSDQVAVSYPSQILTANGGTTPYVFSISKGSLPAGLALDNGQIGGTPTATGNFTFTVTVTDSSVPAQTANLGFSLQVNPNTPDLVLSQASDGFTITAGTSSPPSDDTISVASTVVGDILSYSVSSSVPWLAIGGSSTTPGFITIGPNNAALALSTTGSPYLGTITVTCTSQECSGKSQTIAVILNVTSPPPQITLGTPLLSFATVVANPQATKQSLAIVNAGGGTLTINSVIAADSWVTVGTFPASVAPGPGGSVTITADPTGLRPGYYSSSVTVNSSAGNASVPVGLLIATAGSMTLGPAGTQFSMPQGGAVGDPNASFLVSVSSGTLNYAATILPGAGWLSGGGTGSASASSPGSVNLTVNQGVAGTLIPGAYYATVRVAGTGVINAPQDFQAVLNIGPATSIAVPNPSPAGLVFLAPTSGLAPSPQAISLYANSVPKVAYQAAVTMNNGSGWLSVNPPTGTTSASAAAQAVVTANPSGLQPGIYTGEVGFAFGSVVSSVNVTLVVEQPVGGTPAILSSFASGNPAKSGSQITDTPEASTSCTGGQLVPTQTGLVTNFSAPASWPTPLAIILVDTCGNPIGSGQVVTTFSNGDPPLILSAIDPTHGLYEGTWTPRKTSQQVTILARATSPGYPAATTQIAGQIAPNTAPVLAPNGTLDIFTPVVGAGLGPGNIVQIYGSGLASQIASPATLPLPTNLNGTQVLIGGVNAPLFYVSSGQINAQIPFSLSGGQQYQVIVSANGALTTPQPINLTPAVPSILLYNSGIVVAQHQDGTDVTTTSPAAPGEVISFYLSGLGATDQDVPSGSPSPSNPPANALVQPTLTINNALAQVLFAGLAPGFVGLYQINFQVPTPLADGNYNMLITQGATNSNPAVLPVQNPAQN